MTSSKDRKGSEAGDGSGEILMVWERGSGSGALGGICAGAGFLAGEGLGSLLFPAVFPGFGGEKGKGRAFDDFIEGRKPLVFDAVKFVFLLFGEP